jgi:hypothetical protein
MRKTLKISATLYARLEAMCRQYGFGNIEQMLETWQANKDELCRRQEAVHRIDQLRERLYAKYGEMPDSVALIREDRAR